MRDLLQDVWHDLRAKRLWPVAALLALAILAVPAVLMESSADPSEITPPPTAGKAPAADRPKVQLDVADAESSGVGSALDVFAAKDPFKPPSDVTSSASPADSGATAGATGGDSGAAPDGGGVGGGVPLDGGGGFAPPGEPIPPAGPSPTEEYEYVADVTFWHDDKRRKLRGMRKLDMLPNAAAPVLIFMGTSENGGNAVFLVDSTLKTAGEGSCEPAPSNCAFVRIGPGAEHSFTNDLGDSYRLRINEIRRIKLGAAADAAAAAAGGPLSRTTATGSTRRFALPALADLVVAAGDQDNVKPSSAGGDRPGVDKHSSNPERGR
jgi:hypothetical protein